MFNLENKSGTKNLNRMFDDYMDNVSVEQLVQDLIDSGMNPNDTGEITYLKIESTSSNESGYEVELQAIEYKRKKLQDVLSI